MAVEFSQQLERDFGELSKTLLFEYPTLEALAGYFLENHSERLTALFRSSPQEIFAPKGVAPSGLEGSAQGFNPGYRPAPQIDQDVKGSD